MSMTLIEQEPMPIHNLDPSEHEGLSSSYKEEEEKIPYDVLASPEDRAEYIRLTDELVRKLIEDRSDVAIFMDKSARPVAWLMHNLWNKLAPPHDENGKPYKEPEIKFLNIDRELFGPLVGRSEGDTINIDRVPDEYITTMRELYSTQWNYATTEDGDRAEPKEFSGSMLDGKRVFVVDEVSMSGDTLAIAEKLIERAFPDAASVSGAHWMNGNVESSSKSTTRYGTNLPVWYTEKTNFGRGVASRNSVVSTKSHSAKQSVGRYWLSTPWGAYGSVDTSGNHLRKEIGQLAKDFSNHEIPYIPSGLWSDDGPENIDQRIRRLNGMPIKEWVKLRREYPEQELFIAVFALRQAVKRKEI